MDCPRILCVDALHSVEVHAVCVAFAGRLYVTWEVGFRLVSWTHYRRHRRGCGTRMRCRRSEQMTVTPWDHGENDVVEWRRGRRVVVGHSDTVKSWVYDVQDV